MQDAGQRDRHSGGWGVGNHDPQPPGARLRFSSAPGAACPGRRPIFNQKFGRSLCHRLEPSEEAWPEAERGGESDPIQCPHSHPHAGQEALGRAGLCERRRSLGLGGFGWAERPPSTQCLAGHSRPGSPAALPPRPGCTEIPANGAWIIQSSSGSGGTPLRLPNRSDDCAASCPPNEAGVCEA